MKPSFLRVEDVKALLIVRYIDKLLQFLNLDDLVILLLTKY